MTDKILFERALHNAVFWQNRCGELNEIIEMFCLDAEEGDKLCEIPVVTNTLCLPPMGESCADFVENQKV